MKDGRLEASDLMVEDWVDVRCDAAPDTPHIQRITPAHFLRDEIWLPIHLNKEILEKNGFKVTEDGCTSWRLDVGSTLIKIYGTHDYHLSINIPTNTSAHGFRWLLYDLTIHYVHQLQQAMRIFRIDKKIEL